jgi:cysteine desulfuration protein SufE
MNTIIKTQESIKSEFTSIEDSDERWAYLLKLARKHTAIEENLKDDKFLVKGCATRLYLVPQFVDGKLMLHMDTDGGGDSPLIVRGLAALAYRVYNDRTPKEILETTPEFFQEIGLTVALSATRANGFASLLRQIYLYAKVYSAMA